ETAPRILNDQHVASRGEVVFLGKREFLTLVVGRADDEDRKSAGRVGAIDIGIERDAVASAHRQMAFDGNLVGWFGGLARTHRLASLGAKNRRATVAGASLASRS